MTPSSSTQGSFGPPYPKLRRFVFGPAGSGCAVGEQPSSSWRVWQRPRTMFREDIPDFSAVKRATLMRFTTDVPSISGLVQIVSRRMVDVTAGRKEILDASSRLVDGACSVCPQLSSCSQNVRRNIGRRTPGSSYNVPSRRRSSCKA